MHELFIVCHNALEGLLFEELKNLGIVSLKKAHGGVYAPYSMETVYVINYCSRIATRVLIPLKTFKCPDKETLYHAAKSIEWRRYLKPTQTFAIDANVHQHPQLKNSLFVAQVIKDAICDQFKETCGIRPSVNTQHPDIQLNIFIHRHDAVMSFDTSGQALFKRGWRTSSVEAPLQETMASALLQCAGYSSDHLFWDPFCGSGTFLIEAAMIATNTPAGFYRKEWGFMHLPDYEESKWLSFKSNCDQKRISLPQKKIIGSDRDPKAIEACEMNLSHASFSNAIELLCRDIDAIKYPLRPRLIVTNPPFGKRIERGEHLFSSFARFLKQRCDPLVQAYILFPEDIDVVSELRLEKLLSIYYGGLPLGFYRICLTV